MFGESLVIDIFDPSKEGKTQLGIAYLFLSSENRISDTDYALFEEIGKSVDGFSNWKGEVIGECEKLLVAADSATPRLKIVSDFFLTRKTSGGVANKQSRTILFTLVSLLYYNERKSDIKQGLAELWAEVNCIEKSVFLEMCDICATQSVISNHKAWLESSKGISYQKVNSIMKELDNNLESLKKSAVDLAALG